MVQSARFESKKVLLALSSLSASLSAPPLLYFLPVVKDLASGVPALRPLLQVLHLQVLNPLLPLL